MAMPEPKWITTEMALAFHDRQPRPQQLYSYGNPPADLCQMAASYAHGLSKNHPFLDGNKRTAHVVYRVFLKLNGITLSASKEDLYYQMLSLASGEHSEESFAKWLRSVTE